MKIHIDSGTNETIIRISGQLDTLTAGDFDKTIKEILGKDDAVVVLDAKELTYISSAGLRTLLMLQKGMMGKGGQFRLKNVQKEIMDILDITGFSSFLTID